MYNRILNHYTSKFPADIFKKKAPNETESEFNYRKETYRSNTKQDYGKALHMVNRIWNEQNWSLSFNEDDSFYGEDTMQKYVLQDYPRGNNIVKYFQTIVTKNKDNDPNGILCVKPLARFVMGDDGMPLTTEQGVYVYDDTELIEPAAYLYHSDKVMDFVHDKYAMVLTDRHSVVKVGGEPKLKGLVFEFYDDTAIYEVRQKGDISDYKFDVFVYYQHNLGSLPAFKLKGMPIGVDDDARQLYKSPFYDAIDLLDTSVYNFSTLQASIAANVYLQKWEYQSECDYMQCNGTGTIVEDGTESNCPRCKGSGFVSRAGVFGTYQVKPPQLLSGTDDNVTVPPAGYIQKDTSVLEFLEKNVDKNKADAFAMINIDVTGKATGNKTATGQFIDREEMFSFLSVESEQNFDLLNSCLWAIGFMRYGERYNGHTLTTPNQFGIYSPADLTAEIAEANKANLPGVYVAGLTKQAFHTRFSSLNVQSDRAFQVVNYVDGVAYKTDEQINLGILSGTIAKWQSTLHTNFEAYLAQEIEEDSEFLNRPLTEIKEALDTRAKADQAAINPQPTGEDIINNIINGNATTT